VANQLKATTYPQLFLIITKMRAIINLCFWFGQNKKLDAENRIEYNSANACAYGGFDGYGLLLCSIARAVRLCSCLTRALARIRYMLGGVSDEDDISTQNKTKKPGTRISQKDVYGERPKGIV